MNPFEVKRTHPCPNWEGSPFVDNRDVYETWIWLGPHEHIRIDTEEFVGMLFGNNPTDIEPFQKWINEEWGMGLSGDYGIYAETPTKSLNEYVKDNEDKWLEESSRGFI